ncbi:MAG: methyltransferase domain-containing protein, partial [Gammaproteobacteria bacterium]|nr:methyltransferase domain-containing protein [Gammaproteobacteria bacterium]
QQALILQQACDVNELPGFKEGWFSVQDAGAQLAARLLDCQKGHHVLDCCAAPGGKTCHILELQPDVSMLAVDISESRLARVEENLHRLGLSARLVTGSAEAPEDWWDKQLFDRILLDVPCSASGVIRRHPDIKLLRCKNDLPALVAIQQQMLHTIWPLLKPGAKLLYATCSIFKQENEQQIEQFVQQMDDVALLAMPEHFGLARAYGRQILPGQDNMDGFYYCLLGKKP